MVQLNLDFTHVCKHSRVLASLMCAKLQKLVFARSVACNFGVHMRATEHTRDSRDELTLGLPHYTCSVATGTVAKGTEMQLFCS